MTTDTATAAVTADETETENGPGTRAGRREWTGLAVLALPTLLIALDGSVLHLALPHLSADLHASGTQQLWIMDAYGFMIAGFLVTMGTLGDRIGRRRLLLIGAALFSVVSVLAAFAPSAGTLIAMRALMGVAGATIVPSTLAIITTMFTNTAQRGVAVAVFISCFMGGSALGPVIGGALLEYFWWGSAFLLGVPVMALLLVLGPVLLPEYRAAGAGRVDLVSVLLSLAAILPIVYGIKETAAGGWSALPVAAMVAGPAVGAVFVHRQRTLAHPLMDLRLFALPSFSAVLGVSMVGAAITGGVFLLVSQYTQLVAGQSPLHAGLWLLPAPVGMIAGSIAAPMLCRRIRPVVVITVGMVVTIIGYLLICQVDHVSGLPLAVFGFTLVFLGGGPILSLGTDLIVGSVPREKSGAAAAMSETFNEFGIALGMAVLGSVGTAVYRGQVTVAAGLPAEAAGSARESLAGAVAVSDRLAGADAAALLDSGRAAFTAGLTTVAGFSVAVYVVLTVAAVLTFRHLRPTDEVAGGASTGAGSDAGAGAGGIAGVATAEATATEPAMAGTAEVTSSGYEECDRCKEARAAAAG